MYTTSYIGNSGAGYTNATIQTAQMRRFVSHDYGDPNWNAGHVNTEQITPLTNQGSSTVLDRLGYLHKQAQIGSTIDKSKRMYRAEPWAAHIEKQARTDPRATARIYADEQGRNLTKHIVNGFKSRLVPEAKLTNHENQLDEQQSRLAGEVNYTKQQQQQKREENAAVPEGNQGAPEENMEDENGEEGNM